MIQAQWLVLQNFLSYSKRQKIYLGNQGVVRVEGENRDDPSASSNMSGKSAIGDALSWCLFGKTLRGVHHDQILHRKFPKDCFVFFSFRRDRISYQVRRYRAHRRHKNSLVLLIDGVAIGSRHVTDSQARLEQILECDFTGFANSIVFGGINPFASLADSEQKKILESFLHFERVDHALRKTKSRLQSTEHTLSELDEKITKWRNSIVQTRLELRTVQGRNTGVQKELLRDRKVLLHKLRKMTIPEKPRLNEGPLNKLRNRHLLLNNAIEQITRKRARLQDSIDKKESLAGTRCPICRREISAMTLKDYVAHLSSENHRLWIKSEKLSKERRRLNVQLCRAENSYDRRVRRLGKWNALLQSKETLRSRIKEIEVKLSRYEHEKESTEPLEGAYTQLVATLLKLLLKKAEQAKYKKQLQFWIEGFGNRGIKALIVRKALPSLNAKLQEYGAKVFDEPVDLKFLPSKETKAGDEKEFFHVHYNARHGADSYLGESSGGRRRIDIVILLCFAWMSRIADLLIVDELLDGLDEPGRERVLEVLSDLRSTVLCISHRRGIKSQIGKTWTVVKQGGCSAIYQ